MHIINRLTIVHKTYMNRSYIGTYDSQMRITTTGDGDDDDARAQRGRGGRPQKVPSWRAKRVSDFADFKVDDDRYFPSCFFVETSVNPSSISLFKYYLNAITTLLFFVTQIDRFKYVQLTVNRSSANRLIIV